MSKKTPIEVGQWRQEKGSVIYEVVRPGRRKGWWVIVSSVYSFPIYEEGHNSIEEMPVVENRDYFGKGKIHPGIAFHKTMDESWANRKTG